jgi:hypothetical protein
MAGASSLRWVTLHQRSKAPVSPSRGTTRAPLPPDDRGLDNALTARSYSSNYVADERFVYRVPVNLDARAAAM